LTEVRAHEGDLETAVPGHDLEADGVVVPGQDLVADTGPALDVPLLTELRLVVAENGVAFGGERVSATSVLLSIVVLVTHSVPPVAEASSREPG
jgi:hypothetical protein